MRFFNAPSEHIHISKKENYIILVLFVLLWTHLFFKGALMGVFLDELYTYYYYVQPGKIMPSVALPDANNHYLNSLLTKASFDLFGNSPLALRLPNILAFPIFYFAVFRISGRFKQAFIRWSFALSLICCCFVYDYFAMSRGYGLSMMFLISAIWALINLLESGKYKYLIISCTLLWLATFSNLACLVYSAVILTYALLYVVYYWNQNGQKTSFAMLAILLVAGLSFYFPISWSLAMKEAGLLILGQELEGVWNTTIVTMSEHLFGFFHPILGFAAIVLFWGAALTLLVKLLKKKKLNLVFKVEGLFTVLMLGSVLALFLMSTLLDINYPRDRAGMYLLILLFGSFIGCLSIFSNQRSFAQFGAFILLIFPLQFIWNFHPANSQNFDAGRHSDDIYNVVAELEHDFDFPLTISCRGWQHLPWYYTNLRQGQNPANAFYTDFPQLSADVILKDSKENLKEDGEIRKRYDSLYTDPFTKVSVFSRKQFLSRDLTQTFVTPSIENSENEFLTLLSVPADTFINKGIYVGVEMLLETQVSPFKSRLVLAVDSETEGNLYYEFIELYWLKSAYTKADNNIVQGALIHNVPKGADMITFYLWNQDKTPFSIREGKCYLYQLENDD